MGVKETYGFYDTDMAFLSTDGHCWWCAIDLMKCRKTKTGDTVKLRRLLPTTKDICCDADIYKLVWNETDFKYCGFTEDMPLYVAIGDAGKYGHFVSINNRFMDEAMEHINKKLYHPDYNMSS